MDELPDGPMAVRATRSNKGTASRDPTGADPGSPAERRARLVHRFHEHEWWRKRNVLGVFNWELVLIAGVAAVAGIVATIGSSLVGVR